jgi:hypothetical protein
MLRCLQYVRLAGDSGINPRLAGNLGQRRFAADWLRHQSFQRFEFRPRPYWGGATQWARKVIPSGFRPFPITSFGQLHADLDGCLFYS